MKVTLSLILFSLILFSCQKNNPTPGNITYPEFYNGKLNILASQSDTIYVDTTLEFYLAAEVPAHRSIKIVAQPAAQPAEQYDWGSFGMNAFPSNPHLEWDYSQQRMVFNSLPEEFEEDKTCKIDGVMTENQGYTQTTGIIHIIIYEDETAWMTRYITLVPV